MKWSILVNVILEKTENIEIHLMTYDEVKELVMNGGIKQEQMLAPLWNYKAENK